ncbi:MAG: ABC transporter ATP-binding protein [Helicobacteraceae bacterium]|jgi:iron complex transport system ATP-binding protein|nr:ABC transporter ATP-binding protein [Helicobacteraceae bacterium]
MISVKDLSCGYKNPVLQGINFSCAKNISVLGANGVGKSTLAKALCGLLPYEGEIVINDKPLEAYTANERARTITYNPPKLAIFDAFITFEEFILMGRYPHTTAVKNYTKEDKELVAALLAEAALSPQHAITELSSGQQQLVLIAQALAQESKIILFDEPTANLDPKHAYDFYHALKNLPEETQKIVITHDIHFAKALGYPVLFMHQDRVSLYPEPQQFFTPGNLTSCYGVAFSSDAQSPEVHYD